MPWSASAGRPVLCPWLCCRVRWPDSAADPTVASAAGSARVAQQYAVVGRLLLRPRAARRCSPASRSRRACCARRSTVRRTRPRVAHAVAQWSFLLDASLAARLRLPGRYDLTLAAHVQVAEPYVAIHLADTLVATSGRPNLLFTHHARRLAVTFTRAAPHRLAALASSCRRRRVHARRPLSGHRPAGATGAATATPARHLSGGRAAARATPTEPCQVSSVSRTYVLHVPPAYDGTAARAAGRRFPRHRRVGLQRAGELALPRARWIPKG